MPIHPMRLDAISAHKVTTFQLEAGRRKLLLSPAVDIPEKVLLARAERTRALMAKQFKGKIRFGPVVPANGQLLPDHTQVLDRQLHGGV